MTDTLEAPVTPCRLDVDVVRSSSVRTALLRAAPATAGDEADVAPDEDDMPLGTLVGEFSIFGTWYEVDSWWEGHFVERTMPGAFTRTIKNRSNQSPVRVLLEHGMDPSVGDKPLGVPSVLEERPAGCYAETPLLQTSYNRDLAPALAAGAYGQSFRFGVLRDEWVEPGAADFDDTVPTIWADLPQRTIFEVRLAEFGPTVWPASPSTNGGTQLRSATDQFYAALERRDARAYADALRSVRGQRAAAARPEDPHGELPVDPLQRQAAAHSPGTQDAHSKAPQTSTPRKEPVMTNLTMEQRAARMTEITARLTEIDNENRAAVPSPEQQTEWDSLLTERAEHEQAVRAQQERTAVLQRFADNPAATEGAEQAEQRAATYAERLRGMNVTPQRNDPFDMVAIRAQARSIDELPRLLRDNALRAAEVVRFGADRSEAQQRVAHLLDTVDDEQGTLARRIIATGSPAYERAFGKALVSGNVLALTQDEMRALSLGTDAAGGYAVPFQLDPTIILTNAGAISGIRSVARVEQIVGKQWEGVTSAGVTATREGEATEAADGSPTLGQPTVATSRVDAFVPFSVSLDLAWSSLRSDLTMVLADSKDIEEATAFTTGSGTAPAPQGFLTGATTAYTTAAAGAITLTDLTGAKNAVPPRFRKNATWAAPSEFIDFARELATYVTVSDVAAAAERSILGLPTCEQTAMTFALTAGAKPAVVGDFKQFLIVDRIGMQVELVPQVFGANQRPTGQRGIWAWWENGSKVLVPGAFRTLTMHA